MEVRHKPIERYEKKEELGAGTYGVVFKAIHTETKQVFAIKKIRLEREDEGVPSTTLREMSLLKSLDHMNVVKLHEIEYSHANKKLFLIFEFMDYDLRKAIHNTPLYNMPRMIKVYLYQLLVGIDYCHSKRVIHRDLKPQNILVNKEDVLKVADFGLARGLCQPLKPYTRDIVTLWYRAPEILLGSEKYSIPVDMWSVGCIFAEMSLKRPLFMGESQIDQIYKIFSLLGTPGEDEWKGVTSLPHYKVTFPKFKALDITNSFANLGEDGVDLLKQMLCLDPGNRISAKKALEHPYFQDFK